MLKFDHEKARANELEEWYSGGRQSIIERTNNFRWSRYAPETGEAGKITTLFEACYLLYSPKLFRSIVGHQEINKTMTEKQFWNILNLHHSMPMEFSYCPQSWLNEWKKGKPKTRLCKARQEEERCLWWVLWKLSNKSRGYLCWDTWLVDLLNVVMLQAVKIRLPQWSGNRSHYKRQCFRRVYHIKKELEVDCKPFEEGRELHQLNNIC